MFGRVYRVRRERHLLGYDGNHGLARLLQDRPRYPKRSSKLELSARASSTSSALGYIAIGKARMLGSFEGGKVPSMFRMQRPRYPWFRGSHHGVSPVQRARCPFSMTARSAETVHVVYVSHSQDRYSPKGLEFAGPEDCRERTHWDLPRSAPNNVRPPQFRAIHGQSIPLDWHD